LLGIHTGLAAITGAPEFALDPREAADMAKATADVAQHYPVTFIDPKTLAWINLIQTTGFIYGSRLFAYRMRRNASAPARPAPAPRQPPLDTRSRVEPLRQTSEGLAPANGMNGSPHMAPPIPPRETPPNVNVGEIPGVGTIEFPPDHPLSGKAKGNA